jgi:pyruvate-formate lyase-activating enzyme
LGCHHVELIPYHKLGIAKYNQYGMECRLDDTEAPASEYMQKLKSIVESQELKEITGVL